MVTLLERGQSPEPDRGFSFQRSHYADTPKGVRRIQDADARPPHPAWGSFVWVPEFVAPGLLLGLLQVFVVFGVGSSAIREESVTESNVHGYIEVLLC